MRIRSLVAAVFLLSGSCIAGVLLLEVLARNVLDPVDYLLPAIGEDPYLGHRIVPGSGGHDEWGFRNRSRPNSAEIVAIGDSMTYGMAAKANESWPAVLSDLTSLSTYNMGLGGYGILHYLHLLKEYGLQLDPQTFVVGLYFGNDLLDTVNLAYGNDHWASYRIAGELPDDTQGFVVEEQGPSRQVFLGGMRQYLAGHSVLYRVVTALPLLDRFRAVNTSMEDPALFVADIGDSRMMFTPTQNLQLMNIEDNQVQLALRITERAIADIGATAAAQETDLYFLIVPTKEFVFSQRLEAEGLLASHPDMLPAIESESVIRERILGFLDANGYDYIDPLLPLREALNGGEIYPFNDGHPNGAGYRVIAETVAAAITKQN